MSLTNIQIPDFLIAELYKDNLVIIDTQEHKNVEKDRLSTGSQWFLGDNNQKISILVKDEESVFLKDEWLQFLSSILSACRLNLGDVAIINYAKTPVFFQEVLEKLSPKNVLLFDVSMNEIDLPITIEHYQIQSYDNCNFLSVPSLAMMLPDTQDAKLEKSKLWLCLKKIFNV